jgi:hypothetical protein
MPIHWMWKVALEDMLWAACLFLGSRVWSRPRWLRNLLLAGMMWCVIEAVAHAWMENAVAAVFGWK